MVRSDRLFARRQQVAIGALHHAQFAQVAADAGLGRVVAFAVQQVDQFSLTRDSVLSQDADDRIATLGLGIQVGGQGLRSGVGE